MKRRSRRTQWVPPDTDGPPAISPAIRRLLVISVVLVLGVLTGQQLLSPLALGWRRAEEIVALEDHLATLRTEQQALRADIEYRKTEGGKKLAALETMEATDPGAHIVELRQDESAEADPADLPLGERVEAWRDKSRITLHRKWRVLSRYLWDERQPAESSGSGSRRH